MSDIVAEVRELVMANMKYGDKIALADRIGISYYTLYALCFGNRALRTDSLDMILSYFGKKMVIVDDDTGSDTRAEDAVE